MDFTNTPKRKSRCTTSSSESEDSSPKFRQICKKHRSKSESRKDTDEITETYTDMAKKESGKMTDQTFLAEMRKVKEETIKEMDKLFSNKFDAMAETMTANLKRLEEKMDEKFDDVEYNISNANAMIDRAERENQRLRAEVEKLRKLAIDAKSHAVQNEQYSRKCNVKVFGMLQEDGENCGRKVTELVSDKLGIQLDEGQVVVAHRTRAAKRPWPIIVRFDSHATKMKVLKVRSKLKGQKESIGEDLCQDLVLVLNRARKDERIAESWAWNGKIHVKAGNDNIIHTLKYGQTLDEALGPVKQRKDARVLPETTEATSDSVPDAELQRENEVRSYTTEANME